MGNADLIRQLAERWNAGDLEGVVDLYADDTVMLSGPEWPEQAPTHGREGLRAGIDEWRSAWESSEIELARIEEFGDKVVAEGTWITRGRASGISGEMPANILCSIRDGKIASLEWYASYDEAVAAARDA